MEMRRRPRWGISSLLLIALVLVASACGGGAETDQAEGPQGADESVEETETVPDPSLPLLEIATQGSIAFDTDRLEAPAAEPFQIRFRNASDQIHNVAVYDTLDGVPLFREPLFQGELTQGPATVLYDVPALEEGEYVFYCDAHSSEGMKGTFVVE
jgi:plastocyanin